MPLTEEDLEIAIKARLEAKRIINLAEGKWRGRMDPKDLPWHEAAQLADAARSAAWCITWLVNEVRRLRPYEQFYREINNSTAPVNKTQNDLKNILQQS